MSEKKTGLNTAEFVSCKNHATIEDISSDLHSELRNKAKWFESFCLGLDDSNDTGQNDQLLFVIRGIKEYFEAVEEPDNLKRLHGPKTGNICFGMCVKSWRNVIYLAQN
jgi:hypothetical protein